MPKLAERLSESKARMLRGPQTAGEIKSTFVVHWCAKTPGFGLRVTNNGDRAYISERRVDGKTVRRTLGKAVGAGAISIDAARKLQIIVSSELQQGTDRVEVKRDERKVEKQDGATLASSLAEYVEGKRRGKDGLALKDRTKSDYMLMIAKGGKTKVGKPYANGALYCLAEKSIYKISADDIRRVYAAAEAKSKRQAAYSMQVLRAVLNWHGVVVEASPLAKGTAGKDRITLAATAGDPKPIPPEKLTAWWAAAKAQTGHAGADGCRLILLTGCRPGEIFKTEFEPGLLVRDVDLEGRRMKLVNTKNRKDHLVILSKQAHAVLKLHIENKQPDANVFNVADPRKALDAINVIAGVTGITPHKLRHTFASVAEELVSGYALKRMMNHTDAGDVTGTNYVGKSETQLRSAWQTVADFIEGQP
jgi:integrase